MTSAVAGDTAARLAAVPLFAGLDEGRLRAVLAGSAPRRYEAGQPLWHAGDPADRLAILLAGRVAATAVTAAGRTLRFGEWAGPCALDKVAVIDAGGHTATFVARTTCRVRLLPRDRFLALVDDAPAVRRHVLQLLARQLRDQQRRWATGTGSAQSRLACWLLDQAASLPGHATSRATIAGHPGARATSGRPDRYRAGSDPDGPHRTGSPGTDLSPAGTDQAGSDPAGTDRVGSRAGAGWAGAPAGSWEEPGPAGAPAVGVVVPLPGSQQVLAELLGVTRVTVNRALSRLREDGLIAVQGRTVRILAPELLARRAES